MQYVCHSKVNIKYSPWKMWYIASMVRGMTVDEALKQLSFVPKKGAVSIKETILEAQQLAIKEHNVEFKTNLWIGKIFKQKIAYIFNINLDISFQLNHLLIRAQY